MTINLFGISFRNYEYVSKSLNSIIDNASEPVDITVVDNYDNWPNSGCERIREYLINLVAEGKIKRALFYDNNNIGWSLTQAMVDFPPDDTEDFFVLTDLDVSFDVGHDWIKEIRHARGLGAVLTGYSLRTDNYLPPNQGFCEDGFGLHMVAADTAIYRNYFGFGNNTLDSHMINTFASHGMVLKLDTRIYHHAWDIFLPREQGGDPEYAECKKRLGPNWVLRAKPERMNYTLVESA